MGMYPAVLTDSSGALREWISTKAGTCERSREAFGSARARCDARPREGWDTAS